MSELAEGSSIRPHDDVAALGRPRWDGRAGRVETWYLTFTDRATGDGFWLHAETHAPTGDASTPRAPTARGWFAHFPRDGEPVCERFGPVEVDGPPADPEQAWFDAADVLVARDRSHGHTASIRWDLKWHGGAAPLLTFPRYAWDRELLPGAQVVPQPTAVVAGEVELGRGDDARRLRLHDAFGALAHIYGHGHPKQWAWLHADLGRGEVCEIVSAVPAQPGLELLPPATFVQLRADGRDWPADPLLAAPRFRGRLGLPAWSVSGRVGDQRLRVWVHQPSARCVSLGYEDPDGSPSTCTNTERADADLVLERRSGGRWRSERAWQLRGTAHAEVGLRP